MDKMSKHNSSNREVKFGRDVVLVEPFNLNECLIEDDCFIGPFVEIQKGVKIGRKTRVQSHSFICDLATIGRECFIGHGVMFINDTFSTGGLANGNTDLWEKTIIGNNVSIGSNATIIPVNICDNTVTSAGAVVTKDILKPGVYIGNLKRKMA